MVSNYSAFAMPFGADAMRWFIPREEPARKPFGLSAIADGARSIEIQKSEIARWPFCVLRSFTAPGPHRPRILLVSPLSGHFAFILREMVAGLLGRADVSVTDWINARFVPVSAGDFGFDDNIETIAQSIKLLGPGVHVIALCQGAVPALAATAIMARRHPELAPASLTLVGGPVDPLANPTRVILLLRQRSLDWIEHNALDYVGPGYPGSGRRVYPAHHQLSALFAYLYRHLMSGGELLQKVIDDDGLDPAGAPFFDQFTSLMDLPGTYFLENIQKVFQDREIWTGRFQCRGGDVDFGAIRKTALMTVEGALDDIAAPGQTSAAHRLCPNAPSDARRQLTVDGAGHFSLFQGRIWRERVLPEIQSFISANSATGPGRSTVERLHASRH